METDPKRIEDPVSFSQSKFWEIQRNYFATMGVAAWVADVPLYISSNMFIGQRYAQLVISFIKDWLAVNRPADNQPFYILELGAGPGRFSYCFLHAFKELLTLLNLEQNFCYIISDVIAKNIDHCRNSEALQPFLAAGEIDFAIFDIENDKDFYLALQQKNYADLASKRPLIVIANYTFDCIRQDIFQYQAGKWYELQLGLRSRYKNFDTEKVKYLNDLIFENQLAEIDINNHYQNPLLNKIVSGYQEFFSQTTSSSLLLPLGALHFVENLKNLTAGNFLMIVGDKGIARPELFPLVSDAARVTYDGCFSFMVNFHAISEYVKAYGGTSLLTYKAGNFKINLYSMGSDLTKYRETQSCFQLFFESDGPDGYCAMYEDFFAHSYRFSFRTIISFLKYSQYDPEAYLAVLEHLLELLPQVHPILMDEVKLTVNKIKMHAYPNPRQDIYNGLGLFYQTLGMDKEALELYELSIKHYGEKGSAHHNSAMIYEKQRNLAKALYHYEIAYKINKDDRLAKRKTYVLSGRPFWGYFTPIFRGALLFGILALGMFFWQK